MDTVLLLQMLRAMRHSPVGNYGGVPGVTSWLIGGKSNKGIVRLMECSRDHQEPVIPHSHRFDFRCIVLSGRVRNLLWNQVEQGGDEYQATTLLYNGTPGAYEKVKGGVSRWAVASRTYHAGDEYAMRSDEVHSIFFDRNTSVLFFEGPAQTDASIILEPVVDGEAVPTFEVRDWMFSLPKRSPEAA